MHCRNPEATDGSPVSDTMFWTAQAPPPTHQPCRTAQARVRHHQEQASVADRDLQHPMRHHQLTPSVSKHHDTHTCSCTHTHLYSHTTLAQHTRHPLHPRAPQARTGSTQTTTRCSCRYRHTPPHTPHTTHHAHPTSCTPHIMHTTHHAHHTSCTPCAHRPRQYDMEKAGVQLSEKAIRHSFIQVPPCLAPRLGLTRPRILAVHGGGARRNDFKTTHAPAILVRAGRAVQCTCTRSYVHRWHTRTHTCTHTYTHAHAHTYTHAGTWWRLTRCWRT